MMRGRLWSLVLGGFLAVGVGGTASAATLDFTGTLSFGLGSLPALIIPGNGAATVNGSAGGLHVNSLVLAGGTFGPASASLPLTASATVQSVRFTGLSNQGGTFTGMSGGGSGGGQMGLSGVAKICVTLDLTCAVVKVPIPITGIGIGGTQVISGAVSFTLQNNPWVATGLQMLTIHQGGTTVSNATPHGLPGGFQHGPASATSTAAQPSGVLQLVTVSRVYTSLTTSFPELPVLAVLNLHFVPEPGTLLLLGSGVAGLVLLGQRRGRG